MPVVLARIDDRLLHGQVVEAWVPYVRAGAIVVVSDMVCRDRGRCRLMELITPEHLDFTVAPTADLAGILRRLSLENVVLLFQDFETVLEVVDAGIVLDRVNVGNLHHLKGGIEISPSVFLNRKDLAAVRRLAAKGVQVQIREVPDGRVLDLVEYVEEQGKLP